MLRSVVIVIAILIATVAPAGQAEHRLLFIGNSLTYWNDLPAMVQALARAGKVHVNTEMVAFPDVSLEDHWQRGDALRAIRKGGWSLVVLQQGPSSQPASQTLLREYVRRFDNEIKGVKAKTAVYMVWPSTTRQQDFDGVSASYSAAARDVGALLFPVGDAWRAAWKRDPALALYSPDGLHPSREGSYLAALVIVARAWNIDPVGLPGEGIAPAAARVLQDVAREMRAPGR